MHACVYHENTYFESITYVERGVILGTREQVVFNKHNYFVLS